MRAIWAMVVLLSLVSAAMATDTGNSTDVEISDSLSCDDISGNCFSEVNSIDASPLCDEVMGVQKMDLLAEDIDNHVSPAVFGEGDIALDLNSSAASTAHIDWLSGDSTTDNLTIVISLDKFIQIWGNSTQVAINVDRLQGK